MLNIDLNLKILYNINMNSAKKTFRKNLVKIISLILCLPLILTSIIFLSCCKENGSILNFKYFNTNIHIESYSESIDNDLKNEIDQVLSEIEKNVSLNVSTSTISSFNSTKKDTPVPLDNYSFEIIKKYIQGKDCVYNKTNGKFNICVYPLTKLWNLSSDTFNDGLKKFSIPTDEDIDKTKQLCDGSNITLNIENKTLSKKYDDVQIDLGGIAKGYAIEKLKDLLTQNGIYDGYINIGSSSIYIFKVDALSVRHPRRENGITEIVKIVDDNLVNKHISTSGDYERFFTLDNTRYCHIIDSTTGAPTRTGVISATVIGDDGAFLDALSTTIMLLNYSPEDHENSELIKYLKSLDKDIKYFVCYENEKKILLTNYDSSLYSLLDNTYQIKPV